MKTLFSSFVLFVSASSLVAQQVQPPEVEWEKTFGGEDSDVGSSVQQTSDGGYIIVGSTDIEGNNDVYLIKIDALGNLIWQQTYGGDKGDFGESVQQTSDGGYIVVGNTDSFGAGDEDVYLIKTDAFGNLIWQKTFGGENEDHGSSVQQTTDGGYIVTGGTRSFAAVGSDSYFDVYLVKTDSFGNLVWQKTFGGIGQDYGYSVQQTIDGGYIVIGQTDSFGGGGDVYLVKTDASGNLVWQKTFFGGGNYDVGSSVQQTTDGGYIFTGFVGYLGVNANRADVYLVKTDASGNMVWQQTFGGENEDFGSFVQQTTDGGYIVAGSTDSFGAVGGDNYFDFYLVKTDASGNMVWQQTYGGTNTDSCAEVQQTSDGGYIIAGVTDSFGAGGSDVYLIKLKPETLAFSDCNHNSIDDFIDISSGTSKDFNGNGIPDECETPLNLIQLHYYHYDESNPESSSWVGLQTPYQELNPNLPIAVIVHGWNDGINNMVDGQRSWNLQMADAMYVRLDKKVNILGWNWSREASWIIPPGWRVSDQAHKLANAINQVLALRSFDPDQPIHLMGHSLGAHLVAWTGVRLGQSDSQYFPGQITLWDPPEAYLGDPALLRLPNICVPLHYLREHSTTEKYCYTEFYHGNTSALAHNAELWVNVPEFSHKVPEWYLETVKSPNPALKGWMFEDIGGTIGFGNSVILPDFEWPNFAYCGAGNFESLAFDPTAVANEYRRRFFCRDYMCFCSTDECQNILNPEPVDLADCLCDPAQICEREVTRVIIHIPGKGVFRVRVRVHVKVNWYYFNFECNASAAPPGTDITCVIDDGDGKDTLWQASPDPLGPDEPATSGFIDISNYRGKDVDIEYEVVCDDDSGGTVVISNPEFSEGPSSPPDPPEIPPNLPDIADIVLTHPGDSHGTVKLECPPCVPLGEDIVEYIWIVDGDYIAGEIFVDIELEIGIHVVTLCMTDRFSQQTCAEKTVRVKGEYEFIRGDADGNGRIEITDAIVVLNYLFMQTNKLICSDAGDANDDGKIDNDISDPIYILSFLFLGGQDPKPPYPNRGTDPTPDTLGCDLDAE